MKKLTLTILGVITLMMMTPTSSQAQKTLQHQIDKMRNKSNENVYANNTVYKRDGNSIFNRNDNNRIDRNDNRRDHRWDKQRKNNKKFYKQNNGKHKGWYKQKNCNSRKHR